MKGDVAMLLLEVNGLKHYVKDRLLLDIDQLHVYQNDRIGLVGANGSGKTTLFQIFNKKIMPDEGSVLPYTHVELLPQLKQSEGAKSGGEVSQRYIQQILSNAPKLLLADEPTTNLDKAHIEWVEKKLRNWQGACMIISHDRQFLDNLCSTIWELEDGHITQYKGNYSAYRKQKEIEINQEQQAYEQYKKEQARLREAIQLKEEKAQRAAKKPKSVSHSEVGITKPHYAKKQKKLVKSAKSMETRLENLQAVQKPKDIQPLKMDIPNSESIRNRVIIRVENVACEIRSRVLWNRISFQIHGGDKVAIIGSNGSGKTTLLKKIIHQEAGVRVSPAIRIGYFSQNLSILDVEKTILENVKATSKQSEVLIRTILARMQLGNEDVNKLVGVLSGGERVKVALAKLFVSDINTLVLDEPTNYLDTIAMEALEGLLKEYEGTVIFVSHDRKFIGNIATRMMEIRNQHIHLFEGTYEEYSERKLQQEQSHHQDEQLLIETKISEVLSRLSVEPSEELEQEFKRLLRKKRELEGI